MVYFRGPDELTFKNSLGIVFRKVMTRLFQFSIRVVVMPPKYVKIRFPLVVVFKIVL